MDEGSEDKLLVIVSVYMTYNLLKVVIPRCVGVGFPSATAFGR